MKRILIIFSLILVSTLSSNGQNTEVIKFDKLATLINKEGQNIRVINFWATWCGPCVKELPYFEALAHANADVEVNLISLDFADNVDRVDKFVERKNITHSKVILLDEIDYNSWIDRVDPSWSGAIPATLLINPVTGKRKFIEKELNGGELEEYVKEISN